MKTDPAAYDSGRRPRRENIPHYRPQERSMKVILGGHIGFVSPDDLNSLGIHELSEIETMPEEEDGSEAH
ncbi:hypothetical protein HYW76_05270 [Candidatus Pacearchaeota archaeon]|nr:hypothetical protein [Candidatus Pacearchaeota archaeon]